MVFDTSGVRCFPNIEALPAGYVSCNLDNNKTNIKYIIPMYMYPDPMIRKK